MTFGAFLMTGGARAATDFSLRNFYRIADSQWLDLLGPFTAVEDLYLSRKLLPRIVPALHGIIEEGTMEVLPSLQNLFLQRELLPELGFGFANEDVERFVAALHLSSRPIAVLHWDSARYQPIVPVHIRF